MKVIGLTGGIASGKSTISNTLRDLGAIIIDADILARTVVEPYQPAWEDLIKYFGREILHADFTIDRAKLAAIVFNNPQKLELLNHITHPRVEQTFCHELQRIELEQPGAVVVLDVPLLYETQMDKICDQVWVVWVDRDTQISRLMEREDYSREEAIKRVQAQMPLDMKAQRADVVIDNSGTRAETILSVTQKFKDILHDL